MLRRALSFTMLGPIIALATALVAGLAWNAAAKWAWTSASAGRFSPSSDRVLLVVAHPDDESMFFAPLLLSLRRAEVPVFVLCLSTGDATGLGQVRAKEMVVACKALGVPESHVQVVDGPELQDGMHNKWPEAAVHKQLEEAVARHSITKIITFDHKGVSSHPNHIDTFHGVRSWCKQWAGSRATSVEAWVLVTTSLLRKYSGPLDIPLTASQAGLWPQSSSAGNSGRSSRSVSQSSRLVVLSPSPLASFTAMSCHWSQFVWYRWLFMVFSRYNYVNDYIRVA